MTTLIKWMGILLVLFALSSAVHGSDLLYDEATLRYWQNRYQPNAQRNFDEAILKKIVPNEQLAVRGTRLEFPLAGEIPLDFYSIPQKRTIYLPVQSIKFLDDLCIANAWLLRKNFSIESMYYYMGILGYERGRDFPGGKCPPPLVALQIPDDALKDKWVDDLSQKLLKSAMVFIMGHELGHVYHYYADSNYDSTDSQKKEWEADAFALEIFRRLGTVPAGMSVYFTTAIYLAQHPGDFSSDAEWKASLRKKSHPFPADRLHSVAALLRQRPEDFARSEPESTQAVPKVAGIATAIDDIARIHADAKFLRAIKHACEVLDLQPLLGHRRPGEPIIPTSPRK